MKKAITSSILVALSLGSISVVSALEQVSDYVDSGNHSGSHIGGISETENGQFVVFHSDIDDLVPNDTNNTSDVFVQNMETGLITRVSVDSNGNQANGASGGATISSDGNIISFHSHASNLVSNDTNGQGDIFVHDLTTGHTTRVSLDSNGNQGSGSSGGPSLSEDGRYVAFSSNASNLVPNDTNNQPDIFVRDRNTGTTTRVSVASNGTQANLGSIATPIGSISADGRHVTFLSESTNLSPNDTDSLSDIYVHDRTTGSTSLVSKNTSSGAKGNGDSAAAAISGNGRFVTYVSNASNLVANDTNNVSDIFIYDLTTDRTSRLDISTTEADGGSYNPSISSDGRYIAFASLANNLVPNDTSNVHDVFLHDRETSVTVLASVNSSDQQLSDGGSWRPQISSDGRHVAFEHHINDDYWNSYVFTSPKNYVVWRRHAQISENKMYEMDGSKVLKDSSFHYANSISTNWKIVGTGDFNGDGHPDIFWRHATDGNNWVYLMQGSRIVEQSLVNTAADLNWEVAGTDDFDGDGHTDVLWRHATSGANWMYLMHESGTQIKQSSYINSELDYDWEIVGTGDFDGDGKADILWRNSDTGENRLYFMDGVAIRTNGIQTINTAADTNWEVVGTDDFNGDGKTDILWRHATSGHNRMYLMNGATENSVPVNYVPDLNWKVAGTADFTGDGKADIFWRNSSTGLNWLYEMDGNSIQNSSGVNTVSDPNWEVKGVGFPN